MTLKNMCDILIRVGANGVAGIQTVYAMLPGRDHKGRSLPSPSPNKPDLPPPLPHGVDANNTCSGCDEAATHGCVQCEEVYCNECMASVHR